MTKVHFRKLVCEVEETQTGVKASCTASGGSKPKTIIIVADNFKLKHKGFVGFDIG